MEKRNILVLQGVPCSGKSTWAKEFVKEHHDFIIVNRDSIRSGTGNYWVSGKEITIREEFISKCEEDMIRDAINLGYNVIIDATNLNPKTLKKWDDLSKELDANLTIKRFDISYDEAIKRDRERGQNDGISVGERVISTFFKKYFPHLLPRYTDDREIKTKDTNKKDIILCDIDGTVALRNGRSPFDEDRVIEDSFDPRMKDLLLSLSSIYDIIFISGRTEKCRIGTQKWLNTNNIPYKELLMREIGDTRGDEVVKEELYINNIEPHYNVIAVFDDRNKVVDMWRKHGLLCPQVYYGDF